MEANLYNAIYEMKRSGKLHPLVSENESEKQMWKRRLKQFTVTESGTMLWNGLRVPTIEELWATLQPVHIKAGKHMRDEIVLRGALSKGSFGLPKFLGGIQRAVQT